MLHHIHKEGFQKCRYCDYYVLKNAQLPQHEILHNEFVKSKVETFECSKCPYHAKTKKYLKSHDKNHQFKQDFFKCRYCDFFQATKIYMKRHEALHTDVNQAVEGINKNLISFEKTDTQQIDISSTSDVETFL